MAATIQDYWKEAHSLQGSASRQKEILQEIIDALLTYENVLAWAERKEDFGSVGSIDIINTNPLVLYMQEATGEKSWWIQQAGHDDPHMVIGVADTGVVHMSNDPDEGNLPLWAQTCMATLIRRPYHEWIDQYFSLFFVRNQRIGMVLILCSSGQVAVERIRR